MKVLFFLFLLCVHLALAEDGTLSSSSRAPDSSIVVSTTVTSEKSSSTLSTGPSTPTSPPTENSTTSTSTNETHSTKSGDTTTETSTTAVPSETQSTTSTAASTTPAGKVITSSPDGNGSPVIVIENSHSSTASSNDTTVELSGEPLPSSSTSLSGEQSVTESWLDGSETSSTSKPTDIASEYNVTVTLEVSNKTTTEDPCRFDKRANCVRGQRQNTSKSPVGESATTDQPFKKGTIFEPEVIDEQNPSTKQAVRATQTEEATTTTTKTPLNQLFIVATRFVTERNFPFFLSESEDTAEVSRIEEGSTSDGPDHPGSDGIESNTSSNSKKFGEVKGEVVEIQKENGTVITQHSGSNNQFHLLTLSATVLFAFII